ncbi:hypothetical protein M2375_003201 [Comamonas sp. BIGb0152]|nr:hypothetical protein [Comamonas sp. BIGb0152]MCS4294968.1 hypothetical protein [Comamonas sp. BIGb0152]
MGTIDFNQPSGYYTWHCGTTNGTVNFTGGRDCRAIQHSERAGSTVIANPKIIVVNGRNGPRRFGAVDQYRARAAREAANVAISRHQLAAIADSQHAVTASADRDSDCIPQSIISKYYSACAPCP